MIFLTSPRGLAAMLVVFYHARHFVQLPADHAVMTVFSQGLLSALLKFYLRP